MLQTPSLLQIAGCVRRLLRRRRRRSARERLTVNLLRGLRHGFLFVRLMVAVAGVALIAFVLWQVVA